MRSKTDILQRLAFAFGAYVLVVVLLTDSTVVRVILLGIGLLPLALSAWVYRQVSRQLPYRFARTWPNVMPHGARAKQAANDNRKWRWQSVGEN